MRLGMMYAAVALLLSSGVSEAADVTVNVEHPKICRAGENVQIAARSGPETVAVDQITDNEAWTPTDMYRFNPDFVELAPGDSIRFLNSTSNHTVKSIKTMMPEGAEAFEIAHKPVAKVTFEKEGIYGIRCKIHGRHGMVMLVRVGSDLSNLEAARAVKHNTYITRKFDRLFKLVQ